MDNLIDLFNKWLSTTDIEMTQWYCKLNEEGKKSVYSHLLSAYSFGYAVGTDNK